MAAVEITNTAAGPRGLGLKDGTTVLVDPGKTVSVDLSDAEVAEIEGAGWWVIAKATKGKAKPETVEVPAVEG